MRLNKRDSRSGAPDRPHHAPAPAPLAPRPRRVWLVALGMLALTVRPASADTLQDALAHAYAYNTDLVAARAHLRSVDEQVPQALSGWRPSVTVNGGSGYQTFNTNTSRLIPAPFGYQQYYIGGNVQLKQPLYSGGGTVAGVAQAEANVRAARADLLGTEQTVLMNAATAYDDVLRSRALTALNREIEVLLRRKLREITIRKDAGQLTQTDIDQTASRLAAASANRITAEGNLAAADARFIAAVGRPPQEGMAVHGLPPIMPRNVGEAIRLAEANSPTVIASLFRLDAAQQAITVARASLMPNLSLQAQAGKDQGQSVPTVATNSASLTLNLSVPIYQGGAASSKLRQAKADAAESQIKTLSSRRDARKNAEAAFATWRAAVDRLAQEQIQVKLAESAYDGVRKEAALGAKSTFELLGQLQELFNARTNEVQARYDVSSNAYQLLVAIGRFTAADLRLRVQAFDPTENYNQVRNAASPFP
ncbi:MAG: TolC family outer membrane protein [Rhodospirillales bacterium]|nr:TolC family outer membrane protein [Rhodospirillales bacterium]